MVWIDPPVLAASPISRCLGLAVLTIALLSGCSVIGGRSSPLPTSGPTMDEIYRRHSERSAASASDADTVRSRLPLRAATDYNPGPTRASAMHQIESRFVRVQNPDLVMAVFPHLAKGHYPIPGYMTSFPMYDSVDYLLPGEASGNVDGLR